MYITHIVHMPGKEFINNNLRSRGREKNAAAEGIALAKILWRQELMVPPGN